MKPSASIAWLPAACLFFAAAAARADSITLRASARVQADQAVTLADVAVLEGEAAKQQASLTLREAASAAGAITLDEVRAALDAAGVNWGQLALSGDACALRVIEPASPAPTPTVGPVEAPPAGGDRAAAALAGEGTIRSRVTTLLARVLDVELDNLRVRFDPRDDDLLSLSLAGRQVEAQPGAAAGGSERIPFTIWVYEGDRVAHRRTILVEAQIRARALILTARAERKSRFQSSMVRAEERWLAPGGSPLVRSMEALKGAIARTRLPAGAILRQAHLDLPTIIRKNELATVHCVGRSIVLKAQARAQADGAEGDIIPFKLEGAGRTFFARVDGPGRAVLVLGSPQADQIHDDAGAR